MGLGRFPKCGLPLPHHVAHPLLAFGSEGGQLYSKNHGRKVEERIPGLSHKQAQFSPVVMHTRA